MKYILDAHMHTLMSGHAYSTIREMTRAAKEKGLELIGITEHAPLMPGTCHEIYFHNFKVIDRNAYDVELLMGSEVNIKDFNGGLDLPEKALCKIDYAIASLHDICIKAGNIEQNTHAVIGAIRNPFINIIGHPDDGCFPLDYEQIVLAAKEHHVLLEVNNSSLHPLASRQNSHANATTMLNFCKKHNVTIIMDSDAHIDLDVGNHTYAQALLKELSFPEELIVNTSVKKFKSYLNLIK